MNILSHRGYWKTAPEKNTVEAFRRSFDLGFGTETDVRDAGGTLVISHDMATGREPTIETFLDVIGSRDLPLALNIKADGLAIKLQAAMQARGLRHWFTFDMSIPEMVVQLRCGVPVYTRASEYEQPPACYAEATGVWLDGFHSVWYSTALIESFLRDGKKVCVVSPELHGREHATLWRTIAMSGLNDHPNLMLCTDLAEEAAKTLGGSQ